MLPPLPAAVVPPVVALASGPPQSSGGVVRALMIRTWWLRRITGARKVDLPRFWSVSYHGCDPMSELPPMGQPDELVTGLLPRPHLG